MSFWTGFTGRRRQAYHQRGIGRFCGNEVGIGALGRKSDQVYNWIRAYIDENKVFCQLKAAVRACDLHAAGREPETVRQAPGPAGEGGTCLQGQGSGTCVNKAVALSREMGNASA